MFNMYEPDSQISMNLHFDLKVHRRGFPLPNQYPQVANSLYCSVEFSRD